MQSKKINDSFEDNLDAKLHPINAIAEEARRKQLQDAVVNYKMQTREAKQKSVEKSKE